MERGEMHELMYGNAAYVRDARRAAEANVALRKLREAMIDSWAVPSVEWLSRVLDKPRRK